MSKKLSDCYVGIGVGSCCLCKKSHHSVIAIGPIPDRCRDKKKWKKVSKARAGRVRKVCGDCMRKLVEAAI